MVNQIEQVNSLLNAPGRLNDLVMEVEAHFEKVLFEHVEPPWNMQAAMDLDRPYPTILISDKSAVTELVLAHELCHALQAAQGFPHLSKNLFQDERRGIALELHSAILHVHLVKLMAARGFPVEVAFSGEIDALREHLKARPKSAAEGFPVLRVHYEAIMLLRSEFEGFLRRDQMLGLGKLFKKKSRRAYDLGKALIKIVRNLDGLDPVSNLESQIACFSALGKSVEKAGLGGPENSYYAAAVNDLVQRRDKCPGTGRQ